MVWRGDACEVGSVISILMAMGAFLAGSGRVRLTVRTKGRVSSLGPTFHCTCVSLAVSNGGKVDGTRPEVGTCIS